MEAITAINIGRRVGELWKKTTMDQVDALIAGLRKSTELDEFTIERINNAMDETWWVNSQFFDLGLMKLKLGIGLKTFDHNTTGYALNVKDSQKMNHDHVPIASELDRATMILNDYADEEIIPIWQDFLAGMVPHSKVREWMMKWSVDKMRANKPFRLHIASLFPMPAS